MDCLYDSDKELRHGSNSRWGVTQFEMVGTKTIDQTLNSKPKSVILFISLRLSRDKFASENYSDTKFRSRFSCMLVVDHEGKTFWDEHMSYCGVWMIFSLSIKNGEFSPLSSYLPLFLFLFCFFFLLYNHIQVIRSTRGRDILKG